MHSYKLGIIEITFQTTTISIIYPESVSTNSFSAESIRVATKDTYKLRLHRKNFEDLLYGG